MTKFPTKAITKVTDAVIQFLGLIIKPGSKELGLLIEDKVRSWRVQNQIEILIKTQKHVEERGININTIPLKILVPLLEHGSLEEDEALQNIWAKMLANMLDSDNNYQNHIFPYILSQISIQDFEALQKLSDEEQKVSLIQDKMRELRNSESEDDTRFDGTTYRRHKNKSKEFLTLERTFNRVGQTGFTIYSPESDNLKRLGLIRELPPLIIIDEFSTGSDHGESGQQWHQLEAQYEPDEYGFRITELGEMFIKVCTS
jgi:hypothetical protein